jgi:PAS domain-containing protein
MLHELAVRDLGARRCRQPEDVPRCGLREVAVIAGLRATWYTWLEQGRALRFSEPMLAAVARALRLTSDERAYLYDLALDDPHRRAEAEASLPPALVATIDASPYPAYERWDLVHANAAAERVFGFPARCGAAFNLVRWSFTPEARTLLQDWQRTIAREVGLFRADLAQSKPDPIARELVRELERDSEEFRRTWKRQTVAGRHPGTKRLAHRTLGALELAFFSAKLPDRPALTAVFFSPADQATARALGVLAR